LFILADTIAAEDHDAIFERRIGISLDRRLGEPFGGTAQVLLDAFPLRIEDAQIVFGIGIALVGGLAEPLDGLSPIRLLTDIAGLGLSLGYLAGGGVLLVVIERHRLFE